MKSCFNQISSQIILLIGGFAIAYNIAIALHEFGHTIAVVFSGGQIKEYVLNPFSWSWNLGQNVSNIIFTAWGGVTFGLLFALIPLLLIFKIRTTWFVFLCKLIAACALMINGIYLLAGTLLNFGDGGELARLGISPTIIIILGVTYLLISMAFWSNLQYHLGFNKHTPLNKRILVITAGFAPYMLIIFLYNLLHNSNQIIIWGGLAAVGMFMAFLIAIIGHLWTKGTKKTFESDLINEAYAGKMLIMGLLVILTEFIVFGAPPNPF